MPGLGKGYLEFQRVDNDDHVVEYADELDYSQLRVFSWN